MASIVKLNETSNQKLNEMLENAREEMFNLRFQHASARLEDISRLRRVRRDVAQLETVINLRKLATEAALEQPEVVAALKDQTDWRSSVRFSYEDSAWKVSFLNAKDRELASAQVDLNKKKARSRQARRA
jgi:large subunit ribosomal protein L29